MAPAMQATRSRRPAGLLLACGALAGALTYIAPAFTLPGATSRRSLAGLAGVVTAGSAVGIEAASAANEVWLNQQKEFMDKKAGEEGVVKLESGLMYKVLQTGPADGPSPKVDTKCDVTYAGQLVSGKQFDAGTTSFAPNQVIRGWTEAMQLMHEGDKWELYIPSNLAYGERGAGGVIPPNSALVFQMKINKVKR
eukprot:TRINITY_DN94072_c0_g1_i1.p1 TRINITY_DN94072_c0_g1~~TRINITY_DN94072_c0_g1_i1.p1  ORF type:complete len:195 (-),score=54.68 TRINITY_DN94072_c0_g1_i1:148-732(-)